jgi:hypothetical protein
MAETLNGNIDTSATGGFTPGWPKSFAVGVLTAGGPCPAKTTDLNADLTGTPRTVPQPIFNSKSLSDSPPAATVTTQPVNLPQAENVKRSVNVSGVFGTVKNPA